MIKHSSPSIVVDDLSKNCCENKILTSVVNYHSLCMYEYLLFCEMRNISENDLQPIEQNSYLRFLPTRDFCTVLFNKLNIIRRLDFRGLVILANYLLHITNHKQNIILTCLLIYVQVINNFIHCNFNIYDDSILYLKTSLFHLLSCDMRFVFFTSKILLVYTDLEFHFV